MAPRSFSVLVLVAALSACVQTASEAPPAPSATLAVNAARPVVSAVLPDTPAGRLAREFVEVLDRGAVEGLGAYFERRSSPALLTAHPFAVVAPLWARLIDQAGGFDLVEVGPAEPGKPEFAFTLRARRHDRKLLVRFSLDPNGQFSAFDGKILFAIDAIDATRLPAVAMPEAELAAAITRRTRQLAEADQFSGVVLVLTGERELVRVIVGQAERSFAAPNRFTTKFNLGSMNKMFTGVAVAQLVEQGKLSFDTTVAEVLPDYPNRAFAASATIHHLLTHSSGIGGDIFDERMYAHRERFKDPADYLPLFTDAAPLFAPGERFGYANAGFMLLGSIIEKVSGESYFDYLQRHVFAPAGMKDTASYAWDEVVPDLAVGYDHDQDDILKIEPRRTNVAALPWRGSPAGGGYSTVPDLRAFVAALRGRELLGSAMTEIVTSPKIDFPGWGKYGYGFVSYPHEGRDVRGHSGGHIGINGVLRMFWDGSYCVIVLGNYGSGSAELLADEITAVLLAQA